MKRLAVALILAALLCSGCSSASNTPSQSPTVQESINTATKETESEPMMNEEEKVLAAYEKMQQAMIDKDIDALDRIVKDGTTFTICPAKPRQRLSISAR